MSRRFRLLAPSLALLLLVSAHRSWAQPERRGDDDREEEKEEEDEEAAEADEDEALEETPAVDAEGIPSGYRQIENIDVTTGMRDDTFWSIEVGNDGTIYVGTMEGRSYLSKDGGTTWSESWVIPEVRSLYQFVGQTMFLGKVRGDNAHMPIHFDLQGDLPRLFSHGSSGAIRIGAGIPNAGEVDVATILPRYGPAMQGLEEAVPVESQLAALNLGVTLGAALSARAPRLSILLGVRGRPIANISMQRLLLTIAQRLTEVRRIVPDPKDPKHLMAATWYGLYQSYDGGVSWVRTFSGMTIQERGIYDIVFDPATPKRVYMGTQRGLFISDNNGDGWKKSTVVPEIIVKKIAIDPKDPKKIYVAGYGGVFRSNDGLQSVRLAYVSYILNWNNVFWITIDPHDPETAYIATGAGIFKTEKLSTSTVRDWNFLKPMRLENLVTQWVYTCSKHKGHLYTGTRADLPTINYGANGPESYILESWNAGEDWRVLAAMKTAGDLRWFTVDPRNPDELWIAFSRSLHHIKRVPDSAKAEPVAQGQPVLPGDPSLGELLDAALKYHEIDLGTYQGNLDRMRKGNWLPTRFNLTFESYRSRGGATLLDVQFADEDRLRGRATTNEWRLYGILTWRLPDIWYEHKAVAMQRVRELTMNDEVRNRIITVIQRNYGELQRLKARRISARRTRARRDLYTRAVEHVRMEQLEAMVDLTSGGYLTRWKKRRKQER